MGFFTTEYDAIIAKFEPFSAASQHFSEAITPIVVLGLTVKIMWQGFNIIRGQGGSNHLLDLFSNNVRVALVIAIGLTASNYQTYIKDVFNTGVAGNFFETFIHAFNPQAPASPIAAIDAAYSNGLKIYHALNDWGNDHIKIKLIPWKFDISGIPVVIVSGIVMLFILFFCVLGFADMLTNGLGLLLILGVGPVFIATYAFEATQNFFHTWLSGVLKWAFASVVLAMIFWMAAAIMGDYGDKIYSQIEDLTFSGVMSIVGEVLILAIALMLLTGKAGTLAADIIGGMPSSGHAGGAAGAVTNVLKTTLGGFKDAIRGGEKSASRKSAGGAGAAKAAQTSKPSGNTAASKAIQRARANK